MTEYRTTPNSRHWRDGSPIHHERVHRHLGRSGHSVHAQPSDRPTGETVDSPISIDAAKQIFLTNCGSEDEWLDIVRRCR